jgi:hypothetical protein
MGEKHIQARDEKARKMSKTNMDDEGEAHRLETRRQEKVSKTDMGDGGKAHTS